MKPSNADTERAAPPGTPRLGPGLALLIVDMQKDFMPGGSLPVPHGDELVPLINRLAAAVQAGSGAVAASVDWHPRDHVSFAASHPGRKPLESLEVEVCGRAVSVRLFPSHCVAGTAGAGYAEGLDPSPIQHCVRKGQAAGVESLSAFWDLARVHRSDLAAWLRSQGGHTLLVCGVATDYCVRATVLDSLAEGFATVVLADAVAGVDEGASQAALAEMQRAGAALLKGAALLEEWEACEGTAPSTPLAGQAAAAAAAACAARRAQLAAEE